MKLGNRVGGFRPWFGMLGVAAVALGISLQLEGAPTGTRPVVKDSAKGSELVIESASSSATPVVAGRTPVQVGGSAATTKLSAGSIPSDTYHVTNVVRVDYRDDRGTRERAAGTLFGPLPYRNQGNVAACTLPACSFNIDCDDGNPCTSDNCAYELSDLGNGLCQGTCENVDLPAGDLGECSDGLFCNGEERCPAGGGACLLGTAPACCSDPGNETSCSESFPRCSADAANEGAACLVNADCVGGSCERCQPICDDAADCNDGKECNGIESCVSGLCVAGVNPCGAGADCTEGDCIVGGGGTPCNSDADCPANEGSICRLEEPARCFPGRCCTADTGDPDDQMDCNDNRALATNLPGGVNSCNSSGGQGPIGIWYPGDTGRSVQGELCGGEDTTNQLEDEWGCPKYSTGIMQANVSPQPFRGTRVGPFSDSPASIPSPRGPNAPFHAMGDDYTFVNTSAETHLGLDAVRWVGGVVAGNRISMEFYDSNLNFIEDIVLPPLGAQIGVITVIFTPSLTIPPSGYINLRVASDFEPDTEIVWFATNSATSVGSNDPDKILVNGAVASGGANFLGNGNGIMAFELIGDKVATPLGACCDSETGECSDNVLSWVCTGLLDDIFHGVGSQCATCNGGTNPGGACRRCLGGANIGQPCDSDANCPGSSCDPLNSLCPGLTCVAGAVGSACTVDSNCNVAGSCVGGECVAGNVGAACTPGPGGDAFCSVAGDCDNASCQNLQACQVGACCDPAGTCSETSELGCTGNFLGFGTDCDTDNGIDAGQQHCCPQPSALRCMGGPNNDQICTTTLADCGECVAGINATFACDDDGDCPGSICDGKCVTRWTGADDCEDARLIVITVPTESEGPKVITLSGNNTGATNSFAHPDTCFDPNENPENDPGWWEHFSIDKCARVRIDMCCSDPIHQPQWAFLQSDCGTGCATVVGNAPDPYIIGQRANARGGPYCPEDNLWQTFGLLPAGSYAHPIFSQIAGAQGNYQLHITVEACPAAACCFLECSNSVTPCTQDTDCGAGTCDSKCSELDQLQCNTKLGFYLGPPQVGTAVPLCGGGGEACNGGSCCTGPGTCVDQQNAIGSGTAIGMTKAFCDGLDGKYVGGVNCFGGTCAGNASFTDTSCNDPGQCGAGGVCNGSAQEKAQANPCPICEVEGPGRCQPLEVQGGGLAVVSDRSFGTGSVAADDFIHGGGDIDTVCVWGGYVDLDPDSTAFDCGGAINSDLFKVRVYADNNGIPGTMIAERDVTLSGPTRPRAEIVGAQPLQGIGTGIKTYGYQLTLPSPITGLSNGTCYWLEVSNETPDTSTPVLCTWMWVRLDDDDANGNNYSVVGDQASGYIVGSESEWDMAFCLNTNFTPGGCTTNAAKACCDCVGTCQELDLKACNALDGVYISTQSTCAAFTCPGAPDNDLCANRDPVAVGTYAFNNGCADTDGFQVTTDFGTDQIENDQWYEFVVPNNPAINDADERCDLLVSMCSTGATADASNAFDSMVAIYRNPNDDTVCPCPSSQSETDSAVLQARDENCFKEAVGGPAFAEVRDATPGQCYTIRLGGFPGTDQKGTGVINIVCGEPFCGNDRRDDNPIEVCDGRDVPDGFACSPDCLTLIPVACGDGMISGDETCDTGCVDCSEGNPNRTTTGCYLGTTCIAAGPDECTCTAFCGNSHIEGNEECDGTDDTKCPGLCTVGCTCPVAACGNNVVDAGEECDGTDNPCQSGNCRPPGDVLGQCTCACETSDTPLTITWDAADLSPLRANRSVTISAAAATASGGSGTHAIQFRMIDLQNPVPPNPPCCPPQNFSTFESATCTAAGETGGCNRWVGPVQGFFENTLNPGAGTFRGARLQCSPYYTDWSVEGTFSVFGAEIVPSSAYELRGFGASCKGAEGSCSSVSGPVNVLTRRWGDIGASFSPPAPAGQPDALDVITAVNKFRNLSTAASKRIALIKGNSADPNVDVDALDIVAVVDSFRGLRFPFSGPCICPSTFVCGVTACTADGQCSGGTCVKTCSGGAHDGLACITNGGCPGGTCGSGACRDRCGRCRP